MYSKRGGREGGREVATVRTDTKLKRRERSASEISERSCREQSCPGLKRTRDSKRERERECWHEINYNAPRDKLYISNNFLTEQNMQLSLIILFEVSFPINVRKNINYSSSAGWSDGSQRSVRRSCALVVYGRCNNVNRFIRATEERAIPIDINRSHSDGAYRKS